MPYINLEVGKSKPQRVIQNGGMWSNTENERGIILYANPTHYGDEVILHVMVKYNDREESYLIHNYYEAKKVPLTEVYHN